MKGYPNGPGAASFKRMLDGAPCPDARARRYRRRRSDDERRADLAVRQAMGERCVAAACPRQP